MNEEKFNRIYSSNKVNKTIEGLSKNIQLIDKISVINAKKCIKDAIQNRLKEDSLKPIEGHKNNLLLLIKSKLVLRNRLRN